MTDQLEQPTRRGFLKGLLFVAAAPAVVRAASLMPVSAELGGDTMTLGHLARANQYLTINDISREAVKLFSESNVFLREIDSQYERIGDTLRIRLPNDYQVRDLVRLDVAYGSMPVRPEWVAIEPASQISVPAAAALGAAAVLAANPVVSRRFWERWRWCPSRCWGCS